MSPGQRTQRFKARYVNTALKKPMACNLFWLPQQNKSLCQKTLQKTSSTLHGSKIYQVLLIYIVVHLLLFYGDYISKAALRKNKIQNKKLTLPPAVRRKIS